MKTTAICVIANDMYWQTRYCIENLMSKTKLPYKVYVAVIETKDERLISYCGEFNHLTIFESETSVADAKNKLLDFANEDYVCFVPVNMLVNDGWLEELYYTYENADSVGILSIRNGEEKVKLSSYLKVSEQGEDSLENAWFTDNNSVEGIMFFSRQIAKEIGYFNELQNASGYCDYSFRCSASGLNNFYILKQTAAVIKTQNEKLFPQKTIEGLQVFKQHIEKMVKSKNFKL